MWRLFKVNSNSSGTTLREKCRHTEFFLVRIFPYSDWTWRFNPYIFAFSLNTAKYGPEKTPYLNTFHTVTKSLNHVLILHYWLWTLLTHLLPTHSFSFFAVFRGQRKGLLGTYGLTLLNIFANELLLVFNMPFGCCGISLFKLFVHLSFTNFEWLCFKSNKRNQI